MSGSKEEFITEKDTYCDKRSSMRELASQGEECLSLGKQRQVRRGLFSDGQAMTMMKCWRTETG